TPHVRSQCCHRRLQAHALGLPCDFPNPLLEPLDSFRHDSPPNCQTLSKGESEKLPLLRPRHCALLLVYSELETFGDEPSDASHHPLARSFAPNVDVAVVGVANESMPTTLQLAIEFVKHDVAEQGRKRASLRSPFHTGTDQSVFHHPRVWDRPDESKQPLVSDPFSDLSHQFVVMDSIEKFFQIKIHNPAVTRSDILLRLRHGLMSRPIWPETITAVRKRLVPLPLQNLHHRLLDKWIHRGRYA